MAMPKGGPGKRVLFSGEKTDHGEIERMIMRPEGASIPEMKKVVRDPKGHIKTRLKGHPVVLENDRYYYRPVAGSLIQRDSINTDPASSDEAIGLNLSTDLLKVHTQPLFPSDAIEDLNELPEGVVEPEKNYRLSGSYARDAKVRSYVIARAKGICEYCGEEGFLMSDGKSHYLEAHHIIALADEGRDTIENVIALCPRHHREAHYGVNRVNLEAEMAKLLESE